MNDIVSAKKALRAEMQNLRRNVNREAKKTYDAWICAQLEKRVAEKNAQVIHVYIPFSTEIVITPFIVKMLAEGKTVVAPKTLPKRQLENRILHSMHALGTGIMGTQHPAEPDIYTAHFDFIVVPGLAFDAQNYRLGYGGGYYDNFLATHPEAYKMGIFYPQQKVPTVPREPHDFKLDEICWRAF